MSKSVDDIVFFRELKAAIFSAIAARTLTHPLDTIKTRVQNNSINLSNSWSSLYRGLSVALCFSVPAVSGYLVGYDYVKSFLSNKLLHSDNNHSIFRLLLVHSTSACFAEAWSGLLWTPMEVVKQKMQVGKSPSSSTLQMMNKIYKREGIRGFYNGYFVSLGVFVPYTVMYFVTYEQLKIRAFKFFNKDESRGEKLSPIVYPIAAAVSGALSAAVSNALDIVKTRIQVGVTDSKLKNDLNQSNLKTFLLIRHMWTNEGGLRAFARGMPQRVAYLGK
ncbi:hypothetical protein HK099_003432 [Clydaea vesicula]|uniref:Uncharacterized protein n=1 Tax=Clydaea vesicula TaxID=447962 RepID=A0AAD5U1T9_9FUNG|nr:hypothetical protein HK099_003432 [Clydaea vesicula]